MSDGLGSVAVASEDKTLPIVTYVLFLLGFVTHGFTAVVGLIVAYASRSSARPMAESHYTFLIRTFWIGLAAAALLITYALWSAVLTMVLIGFPMLALAGIVGCLLAAWYGLRLIVGLVRLANDETYPTPRNWLL